MLYEELTRSVIGAGMAVLNGIKPGLDERLYERGLIVELIAGGHQVDQHHEYDVYYRGHLLGKLVPDLIVDASSS